jgi:hypothetical protein
MKILPILINPVSKGFSLIDRYGVHFPTLYGDVLADLRESMGIRFNILPLETMEDIPIKQDGFQYTEDDYFYMLDNPDSHHEPDHVSYSLFMDRFNLIQRRSAGEFDEVHVWGGPFMGFHESQMVGASAYQCNSEPIIASCHNFVIMGFSYERGISEALESYGHRVEFIFRHFYPTTWDMYSRYIGTIHEPFNTKQAYDWGNKTMGLYNGKEQGNCELWGCDGRGYIKWWLKQLPAGVKDSVEYVR